MHRIPKSLSKDRATIALVSQWRNLLLEHSLCCKRVNWSVRNASRIEKKRRARRWKLDARIRDIESQLLAWIADATKHPDLWMKPLVDGDPLDRKSFSRYYTLTLDYSRASRNAGTFNPQRNEVNRKKTLARRHIVAQIRDLEWKWLSALYRTIFPDQALPPRRQADPRVLTPKRERDQRVAI